MTNNLEQINAILIKKVDNGGFVIEEIIPENGKDFKLEELQRYVKGYIEIVRCKNPDFIAVVDEEGKLKENSYINTLATAVAHQVVGNFNDWLAGDVIFCRSSMVK